MENVEVADASGEVSDASWEASDESWKVVELEDRETPALIHAIIAWFLS